MTTATRIDVKQWMAALAAILSIAALTGCGSPKEDEATRNYQGPGEAKAGAPSASPTAPPTSKQ